MSQQLSLPGLPAAIDVSAPESESRRRRVVEAITLLQAIDRPVTPDIVARITGIPMGEIEHCHAALFVND